MMQCVQDGYDVLLTGHSLGGGMAQLIGSVEGCLGVAGRRVIFECY